MPANALSEAERRKLIAVATSPEFRDRSPKQIVPRLADRGEYIASESTFYRVLRANDMQPRISDHRERRNRRMANAETGHGEPRKPVMASA